MSEAEQKQQREKNDRDLFKSAQNHAMSASVLVQNPPHPLEVWLQAEQKWLEAIAQLKQISSETSTFTDAQTKLKTYENNLAVVRQYIARSQQAVDLNHRAIKQIETGDARGAIDTLNQAVTLNPAFIEAILNRGFAYSSTNSPQSAIANYNSAIRLNPASADAYFFRGVEYVNTANYKAALLDYHQVIIIDPDRALAYLERGFVYYQMDNLEKAVVDLEKAAKLFEQRNDSDNQLIALDMAEDIRSSMGSSANLVSDRSSEIILEEKEIEIEIEIDDDDYHRRQKLKKPSETIIQPSKTDNHGFGADRYRRSGSRRRSRSR